MKDLQKILQDECYGQDLEQRKRWYSPAAAAYFQVRPRYPQASIDRVLAITGLSSTSMLLEVGCGPAIATPAFATLGCPLIGIEPNLDFYHQAQQVCQPYPNVQLQNCSFEEWELTPGKFDAVIAASSFHWIPPEIAYPKAAAALRPAGFLILLWNKELQPSYEMYQLLARVYQAQAPALHRPYEDLATQVSILNQLGQMAIEYGQFQKMASEQFLVEVNYSVDEYLLLLHTYSSYLKLEPEPQQRLFAGLQEALDQAGKSVKLSYVSTFDIFQLE